MRVGPTKRLRRCRPTGAPGIAVNSSLRSYLIVSYASADGTSLDVGFYYTANALGRLLGTVLSGWLYQVSGLSACLVVSTVLIALAALLSSSLPRHAVC